jgi:glycosyltransferase involved in cell wall biosynthesis
MAAQKLRVLTWHVHGTYLYYLSHANIEIFLPVDPARSEGLGGKGAGFPWGSNVHDVDVKDLPGLQIDCILFQSRKNYLEDQKLLPAHLRALPAIYLEHDPPQEHPTNTRHIAADQQLLLVQVTHFNTLMWDSGTTATTVIEHGVPQNSVPYRGAKEKGLVMINNLEKRGRRLGLDIFEQVRKEVPLDIIGIDSETLGGLGTIPYRDLPHVLSQYRFFFNPIRYTSLGLSAIEAAMAGLPIVGVGTTEMASLVITGTTGYLDTDIDLLVKRMKMLLDNRFLAAQMGARGKLHAEHRFSIERFAHEWEDTFASIATSKGRTPTSLFASLPGKKMNV